MADPVTIDEFRVALADSGQDFIYTREPADDCADIRFLGTFQGADLVWDATIMTLTFYNARQARNNRPQTHRQFIDIAQSGNILRRIDIGLDLKRIDIHALLKTIIMTRKYKRLHTGRHEFGGTGEQEYNT